MTKEDQISMHEGFCETYRKQVADLKKKIAEGDKRIWADLSGALNTAEMHLNMHLQTLKGLKEG